MASCKKLQPHRERLLLDTLALTTGLRAALLLDYAPSAPVSAIESLCKALSDSLSLHIVAWHWQGCLWVVSHHQLEARLKAILDPQVSATDCELWAIDFCSNPDHQRPVLRPVWQCQVRGAHYSDCYALAVTSIDRMLHIVVPKLLKYCGAHYTDCYALAVLRSALILGQSKL